MTLPDRSKRARYEYRVVTSNGAGVHSTHKRCADAKRAASRHAAGPHAHIFGPFEIERMENLPGGSYRYYMRRRSRWVPWDPHQKATDRQPDWIWSAVAPDQEDRS